MSRHITAAACAGREAGGGSGDPPYRKKSRERAYCMRSRAGAVPTARRRWLKARKVKSQKAKGKRQKE